MEEQYKSLLQDKTIKRWYDNVARGSPITANVYLRRLGKFCRDQKLSPNELVRLKEKKITHLLLDIVSDMEKKGHAGSYIHSVFKAIKSWLCFNDVEIPSKKIKIRNAHETPTLNNERIPSQEELKKIFLSADEKGRTAAVLLAHAGLRLETLGNHNGADGLTIKDLPELEIKENGIEFKTLPAKVIVRSSLSKKNHEYFTFLSSEGCDYLKAYLELRMRKGETLAPESPVLTPKTAKKKFICTTNIGDAIRKAMRKSGFQGRPYVLRSYFATQLLFAESKGLMIRDYKVFLMGHKGDIEHTYSLRKRKLPPEMVEQIRDAYRKSEKYLQTIELQNKEEDIKKMFKKQLLLVAGVKPSDIEDKHLELDDEDFQKLVRETLTKSLNDNAKQKVIAIGEVDHYLSNGWEFVSSLPDQHKAIVKLPELV